MSSVFCKSARNEGGDNAAPGSKDAGARFEFLVPETCRSKQLVILKKSYPEKFLALCPHFAPSLLGYPEGGDRPISFALAVLEHLEQWKWGARQSCSTASLRSKVSRGSKMDL